MQDQDSTARLERRTLPPGASVRHARSCPNFGDQVAKCSHCGDRLAFRGKVYNSRTHQHVRSKTFTGKGALSELKSWRVDALHALRRGTLATGGPIKVRAAGEALLVGMRTGMIRTRSGDVY